MLVGMSAILWIWRCRNDIIFRDKMITDPMKLVKLTCNWIVDWVVLQKKKPRTKPSDAGGKANRASSK